MRIRFAAHSRRHRPHAMRQTRRGLWESLCGWTWRHETGFPGDPEWVRYPGQASLCRHCEKRMARLATNENGPTG